ncbi:MAG TPA: GNAT family N-acetyltransferase [Kofleriaceae bacterium]
MSFSVREATPADKAEVLALIEEMIPGVDVKARWRWMYETNPGGAPITFMVVADTGEVAGCTSFFPFRLWLDGKEVRAALGGDGYVRPAFRRRGLGGLLHDASRKAMPAHDIGCMYGAPGAMNVTPLKHGGSRELGHVARYVRPLRVGPIPIAFPSTLKLTPMLPLDPRIDAVWNEAREDLALAAIRDAAFYEWRFRTAPAQKEPAYVILDGGTPVAACALESLRGGEELHIVDLVAVRGAWHAALNAIAHHAVAHTRAKTASIKLFANDGRKRHMWRAGFLERETKPFLCMIPLDGDRRFIDPQRWFYTGADADLDTLA